MSGRNKLLLVDIGNTRVKYAYSTEGELAQQCYAASLVELDLSEVIELRIGSVARKAEVEQWLSTLPDDILIKQAKVSPEAYGVRCIYPDCSRLGVDRWLVMLAAWNDCRAPCCIVDCGSAITVEYLDEGGRHEGGYIMPGLRLLKSSLLTNTAEILVDRTAEGFSTEPGCHTSAAVEHGINLMFKALQEKILASLEPNMRLYITGGDGKIFHRLCGEGDYRPELVMDGLVWALS